jgi:hypothetical protein
MITPAVRFNKTDEGLLHALVVPGNIGDTAAVQQTPLVQNAHSITQALNITENMGAKEHGLAGLF